MIDQSAGRGIPRPALFPFSLCAQQYTKEFHLAKITTLAPEKSINYVEIDGRFSLYKQGKKVYDSFMQIFNNIVYLFVGVT